MENNKIILGIDPGTNIMGYGLIHLKGKVLELIAAGVIDLSKFDDHHLKLQKIFERTTGLIEEYHPDEMAIEAPFFGKNVQSMLKLGRAQGVAIAAGLARSMPVFEYSPKKIKQSVTGNGNAAKEQVASMLCKMLSLQPEKLALDATDALSVAVCHHFQNGRVVSKAASSWKSFLKENPGRVK